MRSIGLIASAQKSQKPRSTLRRFLQYLYPFRHEIPIALMLVSLGAATQAIGPFLLGWSIDHVIAQGNLQGLLLLLLLLAGIYISGIWAIRGQILRVGSIMQRLLAQLRQDIFVKIQSLPLSFFDRSEAGDLMSRLLNDVNTVNQAFGQTVAQMLGNLLSLVGIVIAMLAINLQLGLLSNLVVPLMIFTTGRRFHPLGFPVRVRRRNECSLGRPVPSRTVRPHLERPHRCVPTGTPSVEDPGSGHGRRARPLGPDGGSARIQPSGF